MNKTAVIITGNPTFIAGTASAHPFVEHDKSPQRAIFSAHTLVGASRVFAPGPKMPRTLLQRAPQVSPKGRRRSGASDLLTFYTKSSIIKIG